LTTFLKLSNLEFRFDNFFKVVKSGVVKSINTYTMTEFEFFLWIIFIMLFSLVPLKPLGHFLLEQLGLKIPKNTTPFLYEASDYEYHYSQLYRPGDRKYEEINKLCQRAKVINSL